MEQVLYFGGPILTMEEPLCAQALLTEGGTIRAVGSLTQVRAAASAGAKEVDLKGNALLPAFLDAHSHFSACANALLQLSVGEARSFRQIQESLRQYISQRKPAPGEWVSVRDYDHNQLEEKRHIPRRLLDEAAPHNPVVVQHKSGHLGVFNTMALSLLGVTAGTPCPEGGFLETEDGQPTGYMEENAFLEFLQKVPMPTMEDLLAAFARAQDQYASYGITAVQEGMMTSQMAELYQHLIQNRLLKLDVTGYADARDPEHVWDALGRYAGEEEGPFRLGGYKIFLDGSPQGRTAWLKEPYENAPDGYRGYPALQESQVLDFVRRAAREGRQILAHCNGDAACRQFIDACLAVKREFPRLPELRPVMIHAQLLCPEDMEDMKACGILPSFFAAHVYHWGDTHIENLGSVRASRISPAGSALRRGVRFTFHQDSPVIAPDMLETVWCAVNRRTRDGILLGEQERIAPLEALKAVTTHAAWQYFREESLGSLAPGKRADLVFLGGNPLDCPPERIREIPVLATVKNGRLLYRKGGV